MLTDRSVKAIVLQAAHYKAIGQDDIWISREVDGMPPADFPWEYVGMIEDGALHRLDVSVTLTLVANHPCGLTFRSSMDLESRDANGRGGFKFEVDRLRGVAAKLRQPARDMFLLKLVALADALDRKAKEAFDYGRDQAGQAAAIRNLAHPLAVA